ncbi:NAD-dependent epimerase/dehydratase family protein [Actinokineospora bangkokensis]|uniref:Nucleoside-diphosphate sugar epimerase n=1 Tax=Actinokineospora bangkokensis TaxID=1193682 RepID=A0A1Q9LLI8_9PSEU|nr:NAD(P)-dependent oxidoreductase [Actinokineospora bangkokensis]OLR92907.1 nucleoside-diphosphate sugar epimerase [Actinokineospora bangkokensis]
MDILVVGGSGLLGHFVVERLRERGHTATSVGRSARPGVDHTVDAEEATVETWLPLLEGHDGVVFAAGLDDRQVPRRPAYPTFHAANVTTAVTLLTAARQAGLTRAAILGSYFTHFHREHPEWRLADTHPYIRSRVEQAAQARAAAGPDLPVAVVEVPFVFGRAGADRYPDWAAPLVKWVSSPAPLLAPAGGTAATTAAGVGDVTVSALEAASGADVPAVDENLSWSEMIGRLAAAAGRPRRVHTLPSPLFRAALRAGEPALRLSGKESGLTPGALATLLLHDLHLPTPAHGDLDTAMVDTVRAVRDNT